MITDLDIFSAVSIIVHKNSVNTVVGFDLIYDLIATALEESVHIFISTDIQRIFQDR